MFKRIIEIPFENENSFWKSDFDNFFWFLVKVSQRKNGSIIRPYNTLNLKFPSLKLSVRLLFGVLYGGQLRSSLQNTDSADFQSLKTWEEKFFWRLAKSDRKRKFKSAVEWGFFYSKVILPLSHLHIFSKFKEYIEDIDFWPKTLHYFRTQHWRNSKTALRKKLLRSTVQTLKDLWLS